MQKVCFNNCSSLTLCIRKLLSHHNFAFYSVQDGENLLREPIITRQPISSTLDHICTCTPNGKQCLYKTFKSCLMGHEIQCTVLKNQNRLSSIKKHKNISESGGSQLVSNNCLLFKYLITYSKTTKKLKIMNVDFFKNPDNNVC